MDNKKSLLFLPETDINIILSSNNVSNAIVKNVSEIDTYDIVNADNVIFVEESISKLNEILNWWLF